jgi:hypothetical protein
MWFSKPQRKSFAYKSNLYCAQSRHNPQKHLCSAYVDTGRCDIAQEAARTIISILNVTIMCLFVASIAMLKIAYMLYTLHH